MFRFFFRVENLLTYNNQQKQNKTTTQKHRVKYRMCQKKKDILNIRVKYEGINIFHKNLAR